MPSCFSSLFGAAAQPVDQLREIKTTTRLELHQGKRINQYRRGLKIGTGKHGEVYCCTNERTNEIVAMKIVKRSGPRDRLRLLRRSHQSSTSDRLGTTENSIRKEIAIMKVCRHVHLVELFEVIDDPTKDRICIVMEHLSGGQVQWADENDKPLLFLDQTRRIIRDVIVGLEYRRGLPLTSDIAPIDRLVSTVHFHGIIHRDIKPANLMWSSDRSTIKIIDFGVSHFSPSERMAPAPNRNGLHHQFKALYDPLQFPASDLLKRIGTPAFLAPEVVWFFDPDKEASGTSSDTLTSLTNENVIPDQRPPVTKAIDIWSLAVTFYCLLFGHTPFSVPPSANCNAHHSEFVLYNLICTHDWDVGETMGAEQVPTGGRRPKDPGHDGYIVIHLLDQMLQKDPRRRPSLEKIKKNAWLLRDISKPTKWLRDTAPTPPLPKPLSLAWFRQLNSV